MSMKSGTNSNRTLQDDAAVFASRDRPPLLSLRNLDVVVIETKRLVRVLGSSDKVAGYAANPVTEARIWKAVMETDTLI